jgi:bacterioferritin
MTEHASLIEHLNGLLAWELRAENMYAHYAAYVKGIHRLHLAPYFTNESTESTVHATQVRNAIAGLGGEAVRKPDSTPIVHTTDYNVMLDEALKTEKHACAGYRTALEHVDPEHEMYDVLQQIGFAEERAILELEKLI